MKLTDAEFAKKYGSKKPKKQDNNIVFCCLKGIRSRKAIDVVAELGYAKYIIIIISHIYFTTFQIRSHDVFFLKFSVLSITKVVGRSIRLKRGCH